MFGRTTAAALILLVSQFASGCCCCRPFFCCKQRFYGGYPAGCCEPCASCYGTQTVVPVTPPAVAPLPVYNTVPVTPAPMTGTPAGNPIQANPPIERIPSFSAAVQTGIRR
jgi:hypothetical protein